MELVLLGGISVLVGGGTIDLGPPRQRCVLAALAVDAGRVVSVERLVQRVWGDAPSLRARATLLNYLSRLRLLLADTDAAAVLRRPGGYVLDVGRSAVDVHRFRDLCSRARAGDDRQAVTLLRQALGLWRGEALTGVESDWAAAERERLHQQLLEAECDLADARLRLGHGEDLVALLGARTAQWPLDERVAAQFMLALHRAGRTADALAHYRQLRDRLVEHLGTDPGTALRDLHQRILDTDPALIPFSTALTGETTAKAPVPRQLPAPPRWFTGRDTELARLDQVLTAEPDEGPPSKTGSETPAATVVISAIGGTGGIGKTWLALVWAHRHLDRFPDGQLFVDLRGFSPDSAPMAPEVAVRGFLDALGVDPGRIPVDPQAQTGLLRSLVAHKRMLIVLDNAADAEQVVPLLPGGNSCAVVVTSRRTLTGLITRHGAHHLTLGTLADHEARALLDRRLGTARTGAEPKAVAELVEWCGGIALALGIIACRAHTNPRIPLAEFAAELRDPGLDVVEDDDPAAGLPTVLSWSYRALTSDQQTAFGLLGLAPGPDISSPAATVLTGLSPRQATRVLRGLEEASLLSRDAHGRYSMHDLIRRYATDTAHHHLADHVRDAALRRVVGFYLHTARTAERLLDPHRPGPRFDPPRPDHQPHPLPDGPAALAWFTTEHPCLLAAQHTAATHGWHQTVWQLAWTLNAFHFWRGHRRNQLAVWQAGLAAAEHLPDPTVHTLVHRLLGVAHAELGRHDEAVSHLHRALVLAEDHHDHSNQAEAHRLLAWAWGQRGDDRRALEHATRALGIQRTLDTPAWEARALNAVAWFAARLGAHDHARAHCQAALALFRRHPDPDSEAATLDSLGYIDHHAGHHEQAVHHYQQALTLRRDRGNTFQVANSLDGLGHPHAALGQFDRARAVWREAIELYRDQGRDEDTARAQRQLDDLDPRDDGDRSPPNTESAKQVRAGNGP